MVTIEKLRAALEAVTKGNASRGTLRRHRDGDVKHTYPGTINMGSISPVFSHVYEN